MVISQRGCFSGCYGLTWSDHHTAVSPADIEKWPRHFVGHNTIATDCTYSFSDKTANQIAKVQFSPLVTDGNKSFPTQLKKNLAGVLLYYQKKKKTQWAVRQKKKTWAGPLGQLAMFIKKY